MNFGELTKEEKQGIEKFCRTVICNSDVCQDCNIRNNDNTCYWAVECMTHSFNCYCEKGMWDND
jgi:hypothetical protein